MTFLPGFAQRLFGRHLRRRRLRLQDQLALLFLELLVQFGQQPPLDLVLRLGGRDVVEIEAEPVIRIERDDFVAIVLALLEVDNDLPQPFALATDIRILGVHRIGTRLEEQRMDLDHDDVDQVMAVIPRIGHDQVAGNAIDAPERAGDEQQQAASEQQAALAFEAGFTQDTFYGAIAHGSIGEQRAGETREKVARILRFRRLRNQGNCATACRPDPRPQSRGLPRAVSHVAVAALTTSSNAGWSV